MPTLLVTAIAIVSAIVLAKDDAAARIPCASTFMAVSSGSFDYPGHNEKTSTILLLPVNRSVVLTMHAKFTRSGVPEFRQKQDLVPGLNPTLHITPDKVVPDLPAHPHELCGLGHALTPSGVIVMKPDAFENWRRRKAHDQRDVTHGPARRAPRPALASAAGAPSTPGRVRVAQDDAALLRDRLRHRRALPLAGVGGIDFWFGEMIVLVGALTAAPLGFLAGIGRSTTGRDTRMVHPPRRKTIRVTARTAGATTSTPTTR